MSYRSEIIQDVLIGRWYDTDTFFQTVDGMRFVADGKIPGFENGYHTRYSQNVPRIYTCEMWNYISTGGTKLAPNMKGSAGNRCGNTRTATESGPAYQEIFVDNWNDFSRLIKDSRALWNGAKFPNNKIGASRTARKALYPENYPAGKEATTDPKPWAGGNPAAWADPRWPRSSEQLKQEICKPYDSQMDFLNAYIRMFAGGVLPPAVFGEHRNRSQIINGFYDVFSKDSQFEKVDQWDKDKFKNLINNDNSGYWKLICPQPEIYWEELGDEDKALLAIDFYAHGMTTDNHANTFFTIYKSQAKKDFKIHGYVVNSEPWWQSVIGGDLSDDSVFSQQKDFNKGGQGYLTTNYVSHVVRYILNKNIFFTKETIGSNVTKFEQDGKTVAYEEKNYDELVKLIEDNDKLNPTKWARFNVFEPNLDPLLLTWADGIVAPDVDSADKAVSLTTKQGPASGVGATALNYSEVQEAFAQGSESEISYTISQCLLGSRLVQFAELRQRIRMLAEVGTEKSPGSRAYGNRVYCVDAIDPKMLTNYLATPAGMYDFVAQTGRPALGRDYTYEFGLFKVEEEPDGETKEYEYLFDGAKDALGASPVLKSLNFKTIAYEGQTNKAKRRLREDVFGLTSERVSDKILITNVSYKYKGENLATARSNLDFEITFKLPSLEAIESVFEANSKYKIGKKNKKYQYSLLEILTQQVGKKYEGTQASRALKTSYQPTKNRLIAKILPKVKQTSSLSRKGDALTYIKNSAVIIDLALINYTMKKDSRKKNVTLTIHYKGFIKSFLNSPYCDVLNSNKVKLQLIEKEKKTIAELERESKYCDFRLLRKKLSKHFNEMKEIKTSDGETSNSIVADLLARNQIYNIKVQGLGEKLEQNIEKDSKKLIRPQELRSIVDLNNITQYVQGDQPTEEPPDPDGTTSVDFFYFGDLVDVLLDLIYGQAKFDGKPFDLSFKLAGPGEVTNASEVNEVKVTSGSKEAMEKYEAEKKADAASEAAKKKAEADAKKKGTADDPVVKFTFRKRLRDSLRTDKGKVKADAAGKVSEIRQKFSNFPIKVLLPTFNPVRYNVAEDVYEKDETTRISVADIPISLRYFRRWWQQDIVDRNVKQYPLGGMINNLLNSLVNNVISDRCYRSSTLERTYFSIRSDFGVFHGKDKATNTKYKNRNATIFDAIRAGRQKDTSYNGNILVTPIQAPVIRKDASYERSDFCNYLIIYSLMNSFGNFEGVDPSLDSRTLERTNLNFNSIPSFKVNKVTKSRDIVSHVDSIDFEKTDLPFGEEIRFSKDGLNELYMISSVHDATIKTVPNFNIFPGQIIWVDAGLLEGPEVYGSIAWTTGLGGYQVITSVEHSFDVMRGKIKPKDANTIIKAKFVSSGATSSSTEKAKNRCAAGGKKLNSKLQEKLEKEKQIKAARDKLLGQERTAAETPGTKEYAEAQKKLNEQARNLAGGRPLDGNLTPRITNVLDPFAQPIETDADALNPSDGETPSSTPPTNP